MQPFTGQYVLPGTPLAVWSAMIDPAVLKAITPGCVWVEPVHENTETTESKASPDETEQTAPWPVGFNAEIRARIGPLKPSWGVEIRLSEIADHPSGEGPLSWRIDVSAEGTSGLLSGYAQVRLVANSLDTQSCTLHYVAGGNADGTITSIGTPLLHAMAAKLADKFFNRFAKAIVLKQSNSAKSDM